MQDAHQGEGHALKTARKPGPARMRASPVHARRNGAVYTTLHSRSPGMHPVDLHRTVIVEGKAA